jgi:hypothetical protein
MKLQSVFVRLHLKNESKKQGKSENLGSNKAKDEGLLENYVILMLSNMLYYMLHRIGFFIATCVMGSVGYILFIFCTNLKEDTNLLIRFSLSYLIISFLTSEVFYQIYKEEILQDRQSFMEDIEKAKKTISEIKKDRGYTQSKVAKHEP